MVTLKARAMMKMGDASSWKGFKLSSSSPLFLDLPSSPSLVRHRHHSHNHFLQRGLALNVFTTSSSTSSFFSTAFQEASSSSSLPRLRHHHFLAVLFRRLVFFMANLRRVFHSRVMRESVKLHQETPVEQGSNGTTKYNVSAIFPLKTISIVIKRATSVSISSLAGNRQPIIPSKMNDLEYIWQIQILYQNGLIIYNPIRMTEPGKSSLGFLKIRLPLQNLQQVQSKTCSNPHLFCQSN